jgi:hypothetical protein
LFEELFYLNSGIAERAFQSVSINFVVEREDDHPLVGVLHLYMTAFAMNLNEAQACVPLEPADLRAAVFSHRQLDEFLILIQLGRLRF